MIMSSRIAIMDHGRVVAVGTPQALYDDPGSAFVAGFLGHSNIIAGNGAGSLAIRPERIAIGEVPEGWARRSGTVTEATFLGDRIRYQVDVGEGTLIVSSTRRHGTATLAPGAAVTLGWHPDDARPVT